MAKKKENAAPIFFNNDPSEKRTKNGSTFTIMISGRMNGFLVKNVKNGDEIEYCGKKLKVHYISERKDALVGERDVVLLGTFPINKINNIGFNNNLAAQCYIKWNKRKLEKRRLAKKQREDRKKKIQEEQEDKFVEENFGSSILSMDLSLNV